MYYQLYRIIDILLYKVIDKNNMGYYTNIRMKGCLINE